MLPDVSNLPLVSKILNTLILFVLAYGLSQRRRPRVHIPVMLTAFVVDAINVVLVEVFARGSGKGAVEQGLEALGVGSSDRTALQRFHIYVSLACILGYFVAVGTGWLLYRKGAGRGVHKINAAIFVVTRLASYITSFWM